jgi:hypothetical protein
MVADLVARLQLYAREGVMCRNCRRWSGADTSGWVTHNKALYCGECAAQLRLQPDPR